MNKLDLNQTLKDKIRISKNESANVMDMFFNRMSDELFGKAFLSLTAKDRGLL